MAVRIGQLAVSAVFSLVITVVVWLIAKTRGR
jgi:hypothetical protein